MNSIIPYNFNFLENSIIAFLTDLEKKVHLVYPDVPVLFSEVDDSFYFNKKYVQTDNQEIYQKIPRFVILFQDIQNQPEHNTSQFLKLNFIKDDKEYTTQYRIVSTLINFDMNFVTTNFISALSYWEFLLSIFGYDNVFTYEYMGNTYQANYILNGTMNIEKSIMNNATGDHKNSVIKFNVEMNIKVPALNYFTLRDLIDKELDWSKVLDDSPRNDLSNTNHSTDIKYIDTDDTTGELIVINSNPNSQQDINDLNTSICNSNKLKQIAKYRKKTKIILRIKNTLNQTELETILNFPKNE